MLVFLVIFRQESLTSVNIIKFQAAGPIHVGEAEISGSPRVCRDPKLTASGLLVSSITSACLSKQLPEAKEVD